MKDSVCHLFLLPTLYRSKNAPYYIPVLSESVHKGIIIKIIELALVIMEKMLVGV